MWVVAGILLGSVVLAALIGFHSGPHAHLVAGVLGLAAAGWLAFVAASGRYAPAAWALFGADLAFSGGLTALAWSGLRQRQVHSRYRVGQLEGAEGVAVTDLVPEGLVRVRGEEWSAVSVNGRVLAGARIQVLRTGVRLEVWGEEAVGADHAEGETGPQQRPLGAASKEGGT